jgi:hypothetical protein
VAVREGQGFAAPRPKLSSVDLGIFRVPQLGVLTEEAPFNPALARLTKAICTLHPKLLDGIELDRNLTAVCIEVLEKWTSSLKSLFEEDSITLGPEVMGYGSYGSRTVEQNKASMIMWMDTPEVVYLKDFVVKCKNSSLAHDAIHVLDAIAYKGLEVWTPSVIKDMYGYAEWYGCDTDKDVLEERRNYADEMGDDSEEDTDDEGFMLPSKWDKHMADVGYTRCSKKPRLSLKALLALRKDSSDEEKALVKAIANLRKLVSRGHVDHGDEETWSNTQAAFVFLWDAESDLLSHALDDALNDRWNSGEGRDCQLHVEIDQRTTHDQALKNVVAIEHLIEIQRAVGAMADAMNSIIDMPE